MENQWVSINCQTIGRGHQICQDKTSCVMGSVNVTALADGLTSCSLSHIGAEAVTQACCRELAEHYWQYYNQTLSARHFVGVMQAAVRQHCTMPEQYAQMRSTLLFCAVSEDTYLLGHIGDGAILQFGARCHMISGPQENSVGGTATYTILDHNAGEQIDFIRGTTENCDGFLLTSDGLKGNAYCSGTVLPQHAFDLFHSAYELQDKPQQQRNKEIEDILAAVFANRSEDADDCSICILSRRVLTGLVDYERENGVDVTVKWPCVCGARNEMNEFRCGACRRERTTLYQCVRLSSMELFFGTLNTWLASGEEQPRLPAECGTILDRSAFDRLCCALRSATEAPQKPREPAPMPSPEPQKQCEKSSKTLTLTLREGQISQVFRLQLENGEAVITRPDTGDVPLRFPTGDAAADYLYSLSPSPCAAPAELHLRWCLSRSNGRQPSVPQLVEQILFRLDNGLLQAQGEQYQWLYQIRRYRSATELCISERGAPEVYTVTFLQCEACIWCSYIQNGQSILEALSPEVYRQYIHRLCGVIEE